MAGEDEKRAQLRANAQTVLAHMDSWLVGPQATKPDNDAFLAYTKMEIEVLAAVVKEWLNASPYPGDEDAINIRGYKDFAHGRSYPYCTCLARHSDDPHKQGCPFWTHILETRDWWGKTQGPLPAGLEKGTWQPKP